MSGAYGKRIATTFSADSSSTLSTQLLGETFAVTRVRSSVSPRERTAPLAPEDAFIFGMQLVDRGKVDLWTHGRHVFSGHMRAGTTSMIDVRLQPSSRAYAGGQDVLFYYLPRALLDDLALENDGGPVTELLYGPGRSVRDPVVHHLSLALVPVLERPSDVSQLFFEHIGLAFKEHVVSTYGRVRRPARLTASVLAPWQERRAKALIDENLHGEVSIAELAAQCRLSRSHFVRAFKATTGMPPHKWLTLRRLELAKTMMRTSDAPLAVIAKTCGFAHQSHFWRVFSSYVGVGPSDWRRENGGPSVDVGRVK